MDLKTAALLIDAACSAGVPPLLRGLPGIGKTSLVYALAEARGRHLEVVLASVREPADFAGLPRIGEHGDTEFAPPRWARAVADGNGMVLFDELNTAPPTTQGAALRVVAEGWVGDLRLPPDTWLIAAMNPVEVAAGGFDLTPPLANRFMHLDVAPAANTWVSGMVTGWVDAGEVEVSNDPTPGEVADVVGAVTGFVAANERWLHRLPDDPTLASGAWPSPRTWDYVCRVLPRVAAFDAEVRFDAVAGLVGREAAAEFVTWRTEADLPDAASVVADPSIVEWSDRGDRLVAILRSVAAYAAATPDQWGGAIAVVEAAMSAGADDAAATVVADLLAVKPKGAQVDPKMMARFAPLLTRAGKIQ